MANEYTTITIDLTGQGGAGVDGTLYAELFQTVTLANNDTVPPRKFSATVTTGAGSLVLPCTATAIKGTNAPFKVTFTPTSGAEVTLGRIIPTESASAIQLSDLLEVGATSAVPVTTYNVDATNLAIAPSIAALAAMGGLTDGARVLVTDQGVYRYSSASTASANNTSVVAALGGTGRWLREISAIDGLPILNVADYGMLADLDDATTTAANKAALQAAIDAASTAGNGVVVIPPGTYWIDPIVNLKVGITILGYGATLKQPYQTSNFQRMLTTSASTWQQNYDSPPIIIKGLTLVGGVFLGTAWAPNTAYTVGQQRTNGGRLYTVTVAGTSAGSGGPTGSGSSIADGGVTWSFVDREQNHGIFVMGGTGVGSAGTTPTTTTTGRTRVVIEDVTCKDMNGDGVLTFTNTDVVIRGLRTSDCWRSGLAITGGWAVVQIQDYRDSGATFQGGFDIEADSYGYHGTGLGGAVLVTVDGMALDKNFDVALLARSEFHGRGITLDRGGFLFTCMDSLARISDSDFAVGKYDADTDRIVYASDAEFRGCTFRPTFADPASTQALLHIYMRRSPSTILPINQRLVFRDCQLLLGEEAWVVSTIYRTGQEVTNGGNVYICIKPGTSDPATGPSGTSSSITDGTVTWAYLRAVSSGTKYGVYCEADNNTSNNWIIFDGCYFKGAFTEGIRLHQGGRMEVVNTTIDGATLAYSFNSSTGSLKYDIILDNAKAKNVTTWANFSGSASNTVTFRNIEDAAASLAFTVTAATDVRSGSRVLWTATDPTSTSTPGFAGDIRQLTTISGGAWRWVATTTSATAATWRIVGPLTLDGSATYNAPSVAAGGTTTTTVTVTGAALGDYAQASFGVSLAGLTATAYVSAADTVTVVLHNPTAGPIDLASTTLRCRVSKL